MGVSSIGLLFSLVLKCDPLCCPLSNPWRSTRIFHLAVPLTREKTSSCRRSSCTPEINMDILTHIDSNQNKDKKIPNELRSHLTKKSRKSKSIQLSPSSANSNSEKDEHPDNTDKHMSSYYNVVPPFSISAGPSPQKHFSSAFNFQSVNNVAPPPNLVSYDQQQFLDDAQLSPKIYKPTEHISSIFKDEPLHQDSPQFSYNSTN